MTHLTSPQFKYALYQTGFAVALILLALFAAVLGGESLRDAAKESVIALIPLVKRLQEGIGDSMRAQDGVVIASDVPAPPLTA